MRLLRRHPRDTAEQRRLRRAGCTWPLAHTGAALERANDLDVSASYTDHLTTCPVTSGDTTTHAYSHTLGTIAVSHDSMRHYQSLARDVGTLKDLIHQCEQQQSPLNVELIGELRDQLAVKVAEADRLASTWAC